MPEPIDQPTASITSTVLPSSTSTATSTETPIGLDEETIDDLIYYTRTADLSSLRETIQTLSNNTQSTTTTAQTILSSVIDPDTGSGLLHYASANGSVDVVEYLLSHMTSPPGSVDPRREWINRANNAGNTALHWAGVNGHLDVVKLLVAAEANPGVRNEVGRDVLVESEVSSREGCAEVVKWLEREWRGLESGVVGGAETGGKDGREREGIDEEEADGVEVVEMKMEENGGGEEGSKNDDVDVDVDVNGNVNGTVDTSKSVSENLNGERG